MAVAKQKDTTYIVGLLFIIAGFIICVVSFYFIVFGFPIFLIGALVISFSRASVITQALSFALPLLLWLPASYLFLYAYNYTPPETYLIPETIGDRFVVVYGEPCGARLTYENGRRLMRIPDNGVLILNEPAKGGLINHEYYIVDHKGNRTRLEQVNNFYDTVDKRTGVCLTGTDVMGSGSAGQPADIRYTEFAVMNNQKSKESTAHQDSLLQQAVYHCRTGN